MLFQSTLPRGERRTQMLAIPECSGFQSTLPRGERRLKQPLNALHLLLQSTLPRGERLTINTDGTNQNYFNPRSHEGSDDAEIARVEAEIAISIHAPTRGATMIPRTKAPIRNYFNPRSHEGSDVAVRKNNKNSLYFNPRSHEGSDAIVARRLEQRNISIHAPTRGATVHRYIALVVWRGFQSTLPRGERRCQTTATTRLILFQSTLPRGERPHTRSTCIKR